MEKLLLYVGGEDLLQILDIAITVVKIVQKLDALLQARENGELPVEGILPEKQIEDGLVIRFARLPISVSHGELIEI